MSVTIPPIQIKPHAGKHYVYAGKSRLSNGFKTAALAQADLESYRWMYEYWAQSASVGLENTDPIVRHVP